MLASGTAIGVWLWYSCWHNRRCTFAPVDVTIFVHGTIGTEFNVFSPFHCLSDTASEETLSTRLSRKFRSHPYLQHEQLIGPEGLIEIPYAKVLRYRSHNVDDIDTRNAWYHIISAYDAIAQKVGMVAPYRHYLMYGWTGLLSNRARKRAGYDLYQQLRIVHDRIMSVYGRPPRMRLICHSHGGNVALWAAQAAHEDQTPFHVDLMCMLATPIQYETIAYTRLPFYNTIVSLYSYGDSIQPNDYFSTSHHRSYQRMADCIDLEEASRASGGVRADMQCMVNLHNYVITHANMWLMGRSKPVFDGFQPLPLVVVVPALCRRVSAYDEHTQYQAHLHASHGYCVTQLVATDGPMRHVVYRSPNVYSVIEDARTTTQQLWDPADDSRDLVFNYKNFSAMRHAFGV